MRRTTSAIWAGVVVALLLLVLFPIATAMAEDPTGDPPVAAATVPTTEPAPPATVAPEPPPEPPATVPPTTVPPVTEPPATVEPLPPPPPEPEPAPEPTPTASPANPAPTPAAAPAEGVTGDVPLKGPQAGQPWDGGLWSHSSCGSVDVPAGQVAWHFVLGPLDGATNAGTTLNSASWGVSGVHPADTPGGGLQGGNADWWIFTSATTSPNDLSAHSDGVMADPPPETELRISDTCGGPVAETGWFVVEKVETGTTAPGGTYTIAYDGPGANDGQVQLTAGSSATVGPVPIGDYALSEVSPPAGASVSIVPNPVHVTAGDQAAAAHVTVTNAYADAGFFVIDKVETGDTAPATPGTYTIAYDGPGDTGGQVQVTAGTPATVGPLPLGDYTLSEIDPPAGVLVNITPNPVTVTAGDAASATHVTVTNTWPGNVELTGYLVIDKVETGDTAPATPGTYTIAYDGPGDTGGQVQVTAGTPATVGPLPLGDYMLTEVDPPAGVEVTIDPDPVTVTAGDAAVAVHVTVTNEYPEIGPAPIITPFTPFTPGTPVGGVLPRTGTSSLTLVLVGTGLIVAGLAALGLRKQVTR